MSKPRISTKCPASAYTNGNERIAEFSNGSRSELKGGLIAFQNRDDGTLLVNLYRLDRGVDVRISYDRTGATPDLDAEAESLATAWINGNRTDVANDLAGRPGLVAAILAASIAGHLKAWGYESSPETFVRFLVNRLS